jgi:hypothetical protein
MTHIKLTSLAARTLVLFFTPVLPAASVQVALGQSAAAQSASSLSSVSSTSSQEGNLSVTSDAARLERRRIISDLDAKVLSAKRSYDISFSVLPVLERCAPLDSPVADCKSAAADASAELDRKIERASRERAQIPPTAPPQPVNVTIIEHRDTYIVRSNKVIVPPGASATHAPTAPTPAPRKNPLPHIKSNILK